MRKISIITDSTSDLPQELIEEYGIKVIPLHVHLGQEEYLDGVNITPEKIFDWSNKTKELPKTSALSLFEAKECLEKELETNDEIICFTVSENMSSCYSVFNMAKIELEEDNENLKDRIYIINSKNLSAGIGIQILIAAKLRKENHSAKEIVEKILKLQPNIKTSFVVDTLAFLHRGGRCSGTATLVGSALKIHPNIYVEEGIMQPGKKYRGKIEKVMFTYIDDLKQNLLNANKDQVFIAQAGCSKEIIEEIKEELQKLNYFEKIYIANAGSIISSHCGPGTMGIIYMKK